MNHSIPAYLYDKRNTIRMVLFTAFFALMFINIFQPFSSRNWYPDISEFKYFAFSSLIILTGMLVVVITRVILLAYAKKHDVKYWQYILVIICEVFFMALFYSLFAKFVPKQGAERDFMEIMNQSIRNTVPVLLLPYAISWLYFSWKDKSRQLRDIQAEEPKLTELNPNRLLVNFMDEKGDLKLSIMLDNLLYIESADNYTIIHYTNKTGITKYVLRNSLKWIEENLGKDLPIIRSHRSYIVNLDKVKILKKTKAGIMLELDAEGTPDIPVSKTYYAAFMERFSNYSV